MPPPFLAVVAGRGRPFSVRRSWSQFNLLAEGERFPLASGDINWLRKRYPKIATAHLRRAS